MKTTRLNSLDGTFLNLDKRPDTWSVHLEIQVEKTLDRHRLEDAVRQAIRQHPIAGARMAEYSEADSSYFWELPEHLDHLPITHFTAGTEAEVAAIRDRLVSTQVPVTLAPAFLLYWVSYPEGDFLMLNVPHTLADGMSCFRLLQSIIRAYAEQEEPPCAVDPLQVRDLAKLAGSKGLGQLMDRAKILLEHIGKGRQPPVRIVPQMRDPNDNAYGFFPLALNVDESQRFMQRRQKPATVNDMLLAATALTIKQWNGQRGSVPGRVALMMPVNVRAADWWHDVFGNYSSYVTVNILAHEQTDLVGLSQAVCQQTTDLKEAGAAGTLIDLLQVPKFFPAALKGRLKELFPVFGKVLMETSWVSNLGRLDDNLSMGDAGRVQQLYFSPPAPMPCSIGIGIACFGPRLLLGFRYRRSQFDAQAMHEFTTLYKTVLLAG